MKYQPTKGFATKSIFLIKGRLLAICFLFCSLSLCLAMKVLYTGYVDYHPICPQKYCSRDLASVGIDLVKERIRFPKTKRRLPQCIIIGVRKGGTRALLEFLNVHPLIQKASDEVHFFDDDSKFNLGLEWYRKKMPYSFPNQITIEKSPAYFITGQVPERIKAMNESIKLLLIVRDPVVRLISDYAQLAANKAKKEKYLLSFDDMALLPDGSINTDYKAVRISMYYLFFRKWLEIFPREQIHIVDGDRLITDPLFEVQKIEEFLGIGHRVSKEHFFYNKTKGFYCVRNDTVEKCLNESKGRKHPDVSSQIIHKLRHFYAPYNREFFRIAGQKFWWPEM